MKMGSNYLAILGVTTVTDGRVAALHDAAHFRNMHAVLHAAQAPGHVGVDFHDDLLGFLTHGTQMACTGAARLIRSRPCARIS